ncbi:MAG: glycine cleavage T C-terminal barrel domain-containing protein [Phycisphaerales bacterium]|nr:glycine cleavage T C-terminal barrel domain-containing protein [Phycisphaerales bacterium]
MTTQSPLQAVHESAEAFFLSYGPPELQTPIVETFGELDMEYAALRKSTVVFDEPHMGTLKITGTERHAFLNNMLTAKVDDLKPGQSLHSFWLNRQGRIDADLRIIETQDCTLVRLDRHLCKPTADALNAFIFAEDIEITIDDSIAWISVQGPTSFTTLNTTPFDHNTNSTITLNEIQIPTDRFDLTGEIGLYLAVPKDQLESIYQALLSNEKTKPTGWLAINTARIEAGQPMFNIDFGPTNLPAETGVMDSRVHLAKGCYLGQEVVARMHARNIRKQAVVALRLDDQRITLEQQSVLQPMTGSQICIPGQEGQTPVGAITSSTISPMLGAIPICFAMLKDAQTKPGTKLSVWAEGTYATCTVNESLAFWTKPKA